VVRTVVMVATRRDVRE